MPLEKAAVRLELTAAAATAACPGCAVPSPSVHRRYQRHLTDLPWGALAVHIHLMVRKFIGRNVTCGRRIFTERLPDLVAVYARKTTRLTAVLRAIGMALGGQAGARLVARLQLSTSGPGGEVIALARSWSISRITASWTCGPIAPP
jgi:transposase